MSNAYYIQENFLHLKRRKSFHESSKHAKRCEYICQMHIIYKRIVFNWKKNILTHLTFCSGNTTRLYLNLSLTWKKRFMQKTAVTNKLIWIWTKSIRNNFLNLSILSCYSKYQVEDLTYGYGHIQKHETSLNCDKDLIL